MIIRVIGGGTDVLALELNNPAVVADHADGFTLISDGELILSRVIRIKATHDLNGEGSAVKIAGVRILHKRVGLPVEHHRAASRLDVCHSVPVEVGDLRRGVDCFHRQGKITAHAVRAVPVPQGVTDRARCIIPRIILVEVLIRHVLDQG